MPLSDNWRDWPPQAKLKLLEKLKRISATDRVREWADDPIAFKDYYWPDVVFYDKQLTIIEYVRTTPEVFVPAGNMLGKDYVSGFIALWAFCAHQEARIVTTSVKDDHLRVLWGEIGRFLDTATTPDDRESFGALYDYNGGPLKVKHRDIRKILPNGVECKISYLRGMVSETGEGMAGHHAEYTMGIIDEASGVDPLVYDQMNTWAAHKLIFGNPNPCALNHFFYTAVEKGDIAV